MRADLHTPPSSPIWIGLNEFDSSYACYYMSSFFCNYYCSKWYQKHWICNWLVKENKFGAATFWVKYLFPSLYLSSGTFFRDLLERIGLPVLSLLPLTFVNWEGPYLAAGYLHNFRPYFDIVFAPSSQEQALSCWNGSQIIT